MISLLTGTLAEKLGDMVVIDVRGVGYGLYMTHEDQSQLGSAESHKIYIYEHIREQSHDLFGFLRLETKQLFEQLLGVNGVGPKMALSVLNVAANAEVRQAIANGDTKKIQQASGVGKRVAERIVVDLKDKVGLVGVDLATSDLLQGAIDVSGDEAVQALVALGYAPYDAQKALNNVPNDIPTEARITQALRQQ